MQILFSYRYAQQTMLFWLCHNDIMLILHARKSRKSYLAFRTNNGKVKNCEIIHMGLLVVKIAV